MLSATRRQLANVLGSGILPQQLHRCYAASSEPITVEVMPVRAHRIDPPSNVVQTTLDELVQLYELMYKMRRMEIAADMMYKAKLIRGFCHL